MLVRHGPAAGSRVDYAFDNSGAPRYSGIDTVVALSLERRGDRRGLYVVARLSGTGGFLDECLLGPRGTGDALGCWPLPNVGPALAAQLHAGETTGSRGPALRRIDPAGSITYVQRAWPEKTPDDDTRGVFLQADVRLQGGRYVVTRAGRRK